MRSIAALSPEMWSRSDSILTCVQPSPRQLG